MGRPKERKRFQEETQEDAALRKAEDAQGSHFFGAAGHCCIHGVHSGETTADRHNNAHEEAEEFDGKRRGLGLSAVVFLLAQYSSR